MLQLLCHGRLTFNEKFPQHCCGVITVLSTHLSTIVKTFYMAGPNPKFLKFWASVLYAERTICRLATVFLIAWYTIEATQIPHDPLPPGESI